MASASRNLDNVNLSVDETSPVPGPHVEREAPHRLPPLVGEDALSFKTEASQNKIGLPLLGAFHAETPGPALNLSELTRQDGCPARLRNGAALGVGGNGRQGEELAGEELAPVSPPRASPSKSDNPTALGSTAPVILNGAATVTAPSAKPLTPSEDAPLLLEPIEFCFDLKGDDEDHGSPAAPDGAPQDQGPGYLPPPPGEESAPISQAASLLRPPTREDHDCSPAVVRSVAHRPIPTPGAEREQTRGSPTAAVTPSKKGRGASYPGPWETKENLTAVAHSDDEGPSVPDGGEQRQDTSPPYLPLTQKNPVSGVLRRVNSQRELSAKVTSVGNCPSVLADTVQQDRTSTHPSSREVLIQKATPALDPCSSRERNMAEVSMGVNAIPGSGPEKEGTEARATDGSRYRAITAKTRPATGHESQGYLNRVLRVIILFALTLTAHSAEGKNETSVCAGQPVSINFGICANKANNFILKHNGRHVCTFTKCEEKSTFKYNHKGCITVHISQTLPRHDGIYNLEYGSEPLPITWKLVVKECSTPSPEATAAERAEGRQDSPTNACAVHIAKTGAGVVLALVILQLLL